MSPQQNGLLPSNANNRFEFLHIEMQASEAGTTLQRGIYPAIFFIKFPTILQKPMKRFNMIPATIRFLLLFCLAFDAFRTESAVPRPSHYLADMAENYYGIRENTDQDAAVKEQERMIISDAKRLLPLLEYNVKISDEKISSLVEQAVLTVPGGSYSNLKQGIGPTT